MENSWKSPGNNGFLQSLSIMLLISILCCNTLVLTSGETFHGTMYYTTMISSQTHDLYKSHLVFVYRRFWCIFAISINNFHISNMLCTRQIDEQVVNLSCCKVEEWLMKAQDGDQISLDCYSSEYSSSSSASYGHIIEFGGWVGDQDM